MLTGQELATAETPEEAESVHCAAEMPTAAARVTLPQRPIYPLRGGLQAGGIHRVGVTHSPPSGARLEETPTSPGRPLTLAKTPRGRRFQGGQKSKMLRGQGWGRPARLTVSTHRAPQEKRVLSCLRFPNVTRGKLSIPTPKSLTIGNESWWKRGVLRTLLSHGKP